MANDLPNLRVATSPLSNRIFAGYARADKNRPDLMTWTRKQDVTAQAIDAVLRHLLDGKKGMEWKFGNDTDTIVVTIQQKRRRKSRTIPLATLDAVNGKGVANVSE